MRSLRVVLLNPHIQIGLQLLQRLVDFTPKCGGVKLILNGLVKPLANAVGLWMLDLGSGVLDVFQVQIQLKLVLLSIAAVLAASVSEDAQQWYILLIIKRYYPVIEQISSRNGMFLIVKFDNRYFAVRVDVSLLVNPPHPFDGANVIGV